jgi:glycosyltransferase involved in cell wall biosynthesis
MIKEFLSKHSKLLSKNIILYLGRINEKKGVDLLLRAFAKILPEHPNTLLVIAGNREAYPDYVSKLDDLIVYMDLSERVYWTGFLEENDKRCLFALAYLFSHVTRSEGMAVAVLEAMAAGLPVIVSPGCYMDQAVARGAVVLSEYEENSLAVNLDKLLTNHAYSEQLGKSARQFTNQYHDWRKNAVQIVNAYEDSVNYEQIS